MVRLRISKKPTAAGRDPVGFCAVFLITKKREVRKVKTVTRDQYMTFLRSYDRETGRVDDRPVEGSNISVMQTTDRYTGKLIAQAIYCKGSAPRYQVAVSDGRWGLGC